MTDYILGIDWPHRSRKIYSSEELRRQGCTIIDCDQISREVTTVCTPCLDELRQEFGTEIFEKDGTLNRQQLAKKAFSSAEKTKRLNAITQPWICRRIGEEIKRYRQKESSGILVLDAPLLLEAGADVFCNQILVVLAPAELRLQRIMQRDNLTESLARARMQAQPEDAFLYQENADICLNGTFGSDALSCQVRQIVSGIVR